jgi:integrase
MHVLRIRTEGSCGRFAFPYVALLWHERRFAVSVSFKELSILRGILLRAKRWHLFDEIKRLKVGNNRVVHVLSNDEKIRLLKLSQRDPRWWRARLAMLLALNTTMRAGEIRNLQWQHVNWLERTVQVRRGKTAESQREIALNQEAYDAMVSLRDDASLFSGTRWLPTGTCSFGGQQAEIQTRCAL